MLELVVGRVDIGMTLLKSTVSMKIIDTCIHGNDTHYIALGITDYKQLVLDLEKPPSVYQISIHSSPPPFVPPPFTLRSAQPAKSTQS
jgi:hypothetical protein